MPPIWALKLAGVAILALSAYGVYWTVDNGGYQRGTAEIRQQWANANEIAEDQQAARIKTAQEKHDADQADINRLAADARRVRVHFPTCPAAPSVESTDGAGGVLPNRVDEEFGKFQEEVGRLIERCDQLNIDAIRQNEGL
jgi:hypothetical protein